MFDVLAKANPDAQETGNESVGAEVAVKGNLCETMFSTEVRGV